MEVELCLFLRQRSHWWMLPAWLLSQHIHLSLWLIRHKETTFDISPMQLLPDTPSSCRSACVCVRAFNKEYVSLNLKQHIFWVLHVYWGHIPFTNKSNPLFSSSDVGSKWQLLCSLLHPTTKHLNRYEVSIFLSTSALAVKRWWLDRRQLTQGGSKVKRYCQSTIRGAVFVHVTSHRQEAENGLIWKRGYYF